MKSSAMRRNRSKIGHSLVWTPEEAKYLRAIFRWQESTPSLDDEKRRRQEEAARRRQQEQKPAGECRLLIVGGRGTGKTAILTRFGQGTFQDTAQPADPFYERGCRRPITLETTTTHPTPKFSTSPSTTTATTTATTTTKAQQHQPNKKPQPQPHSHSHSHPNAAPPSLQKQTYMLDALEMPSKHLLSNPMLAQALSITEGAAIVYSVRDEASFRLALGLAEFIREHFSPPAPATTPAAAGGGGGSSSPTSPTSPPSPTLPGTGVGAGAGGGVGIGNKGRVYPIVLVGNKADDGDDDEAVGGLREEREVMYTEGVKAAAGLGGEWGGVPFVEVSAKTGEGVEGLFRVLGKEVLKGRAVMRERRERAERERLGGEMGSAKNAGGQGGKKRFALWRALFGRRKVAGG